MAETEDQLVGANQLVYIKFLKVTLLFLIVSRFCL